MSPYATRTQVGTVRFLGAAEVCFTVADPIDDELAAMLKARFTSDLHIEITVEDREIHAEWPTDEEAFKGFSSAAGIIVAVLDLPVDDTGYWQMLVSPRAMTAYHAILETDKKAADTMAKFFA